MTPQTLAGALATAVARWPDRTALVFRGRRLAYAELGQAIASIASGLRRLGIAPGDRIVCSVSNRPELLLSLAGAWAAGAVPVAADYRSTATELTHLVDLTGARALVYEPVDGAADPYGPPRTLVAQDAGLLVLSAGDHHPPEGMPAILELAGPVADGLPGEPDSDREAMIFVSSGTTGQPKVAVGFHGNLSRRWTRLGEWLGFGPDDIHLAHLPLSHGFGLMMAVAGLLSGGRLVLVRDFASGELPGLIAAERATTFHGAPTHFRMLLSRLDPARHDVRSLRLSVGTAAPFPPALVREIWDRLSVKLMIMYGSSEGVGVATTDKEDILLGAVGRPAPESIAILGDGGRHLSAGEVGEIAFARKVYPVQYVGRNQSATLDDPEWYRSGDFGRLDEAGRLYVFGRLKRQIDRGGLKVDPVEVERAIQRLPTIADAAVLGIPNPVLGQVVCACVVPEAGQGLTLEGLRQALAGDLTPYKLPEELCLLEQIPRTPIGKVDLDRLNAEFGARHAVTT